MRRRVESTRVSAVPCLLTAALIGAAFAGQACTDRAVDDTRSDVDKTAAIAEAIARGTEQVSNVVNRLEVKEG